MANSIYTSIIWLTQGKYAIVDNEDYEYLNQWKWHFNSDYAFRNEYGAEKPTKISMHGLIAATPKGMVTDHINFNRLDNRKSNLRACTNKQNSRYSKARIGESVYKGVSRTSKSEKWRARIVVNGEEIYLGVFICEKEAGIAYNNAAIKFYKEYAFFNSI